MKSCFVIVLAGVCLFGVKQRSHAIAVDDYSVAETHPAVAGYSLDWDYIYRYKNSSSVAVDHYWILTAAHVADDGGAGSLTIGGETYAQQEIVFHDTADLALVRYDKPFPGYYLLHSGEIHNGLNGPRREYYELIMAGFGYAGTVSASSFTQSGTAGIKRWGTNRGVTETLASLNVGGTAGDVSTQCFSVDFTLGDTSYEAGGNVYDSGGPVFVDDGSGWKLTGINLYRNGSNPYIGNYAAMIHDYIGWIKSVVVDYDTDMDGLPDWWETQYGETEATADPDGDGFTNYEEWLADTHPADGNSFLRVMDYSGATNLVFSSSTNRKYQIEYSTNLLVGTWIEYGSLIDGAGTQTVQSVSISDSNRYYRVRTQLR